MIPISDKEFAQFQRFIYDVAGISLSAAKKPLVCGRLGKRLQHYQLDSYTAYFNLLASGRVEAEIQTAVDLLTTNETHLFREPQHFDLLRSVATSMRGRDLPFRVWSAACSTGEEPFSIAMVLDDCMPDGNWEVLGSDISSRVLERARRAVYPIEHARELPKTLLHKYCLRGVKEQEGQLLICRELRQKVSFQKINLNESLPRLGQFDMIFLRNVMIYFNAQTKQQIVARVVEHLRLGGYLLTGHSESLNGITSAVSAQAPAVYRKP